MSIYSIQLNGNLNTSKNNSVKLLLSSLGILVITGMIIYIF